MEGREEAIIDIEVQTSKAVALLQRYISWVSRLGLSVSTLPSISLFFEGDNSEGGYDHRFVSHGSVTAIPSPTLSHEPTNQTALSPPVVLVSACVLGYSVAYHGRGGWRTNLPSSTPAEPYSSSSSITRSSVAVGDLQLHPPQQSTHPKAKAKPHSAVFNKGRLLNDALLILQAAGVWEVKGVCPEVEGMKLPTPRGKLRLVHNQGPINNNNSILDNQNDRRGSSKVHDDLDQSAENNAARRPGSISSSTISSSSRFDGDHPPTKAAAFPYWFRYEESGENMTGSLEEWWQGVREGRIPLGDTYPTAIERRLVGRHWRWY